jgi:hypothetical protein
MLPESPSTIEAAMHVRDGPSAFAGAEELCQCEGAAVGGVATGE